MLDPPAADADPKDSAVAKTAGIVVFSGIALSILKAINPLNRNRNETHPFSEPTQPIQMPTSQPPPKPEEPIFKMSYEVWFCFQSLNFDFFFFFNFKEAKNRFLSFQC